VVRIYNTSHKPDQGKKLTMKSRLILIAIMFIAINLIFYFGIDSSDESEKSVDFDDKNQITNEKDGEIEQEITNSLNPIP